MLVQKSTIVEKIPLHNIALTGGCFAIVDPELFVELSQYYWIATKSHGKPYAARRVRRDGKSKYIFMHRQIMRTPDYQVCHHINKNPIDNRKANLLNMTPDQHKEIHNFS